MNIENLHGVIPKSVMAELPAVIAKFNITTSLRLAHFLSQCHHESAGFTATNENLNYSATGLIKTFPKKFSPELAHISEHHPEKIANIVYADRMGNGDTASGDGWSYHGRGYIQLTGRENYELFNECVNDDLLYRPDLVATKYPLLSAAWFFDSKGIFAIADTGSRAETVTAVTKRINGGINGLSERIELLNKYLKLLKN